MRHTVRSIIAAKRCSRKNAAAQPTVRSSRVHKNADARCSISHPNSDESGYGGHTRQNNGRELTHKQRAALQECESSGRKKSPVSHTGPEFEIVRRPRCHALRSSAVINAARSSEVRKVHCRLKVTKRIMVTPEIKGSGSVNLTLNIGCWFSGNRVISQRSIGPLVLQGCT